MSSTNTECICALQMFSSFQCLEINSASGVNICYISHLSASPAVQCRGDIVDVVSLH